MKKLLVLLAILCVSTSARAWTLPQMGRTYFVGSTHELEMIRAGLNHVAGYPQSSWTLPLSDQTWGLIGPGLGMGPVDCMDAMYAPNQGPYDGTEDYLGMSTTVIVDGVEVGVEIPGIEDLRTQANWPGECYGYWFHALCGIPMWADMDCPDPAP